jgi:uncharacterized protein YukJ
MKKDYGFVKCKLASDQIPLKGSTNHQTHETQYHLHPALSVSDGQGGVEDWDSAINVGTNDSDDLVQYKIVNDFHHSITGTLQGSPDGFNELSDVQKLPALDFLRSDILAETGPWRSTDPMDGDESAEPIKSIKRMLVRAYNSHADVYLFGRLYDQGGSGIHDIHMNQGSQGKHFFNDGSDKDGNLVWQDGAVIVDFGTSWTAYFAVFTQQVVPTDNLGNPAPGAHPISVADDGSLAGQ